MRKLLPILLIVCFCCCSEKKINRQLRAENKSTSIDFEDFIVIFEVKDPISIFDENPLIISIENKRKEPIQLKSVKVQGDIEKERRAANSSSPDGFLFFRKPKTPLNKKYELPDALYASVLKMVSNLYLPNSKKAPHEYWDKKNFDSVSFLNLVVEIKYENNKEVSKDLSIPITAISVKNWSYSEAFFVKQFDYYYEKWYASDYLASLIQNKKIVDELSTTTLSKCISDYKKRVWIQ